jgi:hypothetical protein
VKAISITWKTQRGFRRLLEANAMYCHQADKRGAHHSDPLDEAPCGDKRPDGDETCYLRISTLRYVINTGMDAKREDNSA